MGRNTCKSMGRVLWGHPKHRNTVYLPEYTGIHLSPKLGQYCNKTCLMSHLC